MTGFHADRADVAAAMRSIYGEDLICATRHTADDEPPDDVATPKELWLSCLNRFDVCLRIFDSHGEGYPWDWCGCETCCGWRDR